ncbi:MAG: hypothetical protein O2895_01695, partial [Chloroflexi bacterium]|nr:hypothetical protein [Chloroflexota bacterium]
MHDAPVEVEVLPPQGEQLALAQPGRGSGRVGRLEPIALDVREQARELREIERSPPVGRTGSRQIEPPARLLDDAVAAIAAAARPIVIVGNGARDGIEDITAFAESIGAPIVTTFKAKGLISDHHELAGGVLGRSGTPVASWLMNESDLIVAFGVSFSNHTGIADYKPIVQVDFDPMALGRFHAVSVPVQAHTGAAARAFASAMPADRA